MIVGLYCQEIFYQIISGLPVGPRILKILKFANFLENPKIDIVVHWAGPLKTNEQVV